MPAADSGSGRNSFPIQPHFTCNHRHSHRPQMSEASRGKVDDKTVQDYRHHRVSRCILAVLEPFCVQALCTTTSPFPSTGSPQRYLVIAYEILRRSLRDYNNQMPPVRNLNWRERLVLHDTPSDPANLQASSAPSEHGPGHNLEVPENPDEADTESSRFARPGTCSPNRI